VTLLCKTENRENPGGTYVFEDFVTKVQKFFYTFYREKLNIKKFIKSFLSHVFVTPKIDRKEVTGDEMNMIRK